MTSDELDRKIAEIAAVREANDGWEEHHSAIADIYPDLVADRERLKAEVKLAHDALVDRNVSFVEEVAKKDNIIADQSMTIGWHEQLNTHLEQLIGFPNRLKAVMPNAKPYLGEGPTMIDELERLKARVAELEAWIKATGRGMPPKHGIDMNWPEPKPQPDTLVDTTTFPRPESDGGE